MSAQWLAYVALLGVLLATVAAAADAATRALARPTRWVWAAALAALLGVTILSLRVGDRVTGSDATAITATGEGVHAHVGGGGLSGVVERLRVRSADAMQYVLAKATAVTPAPIIQRFALLWWVSSLMMAAVLISVHLRMSWSRRRWPTTLLHGRRVRLAPDVGPAIVGLTRPEIVVPHWLLLRANEEQRVVVQHEDEHLLAGDHLLLTGATIVVALLPWHPAAWWMLSRLRLSLELDCDARILRAGITPRQYGDLLIEMAGECSGIRLGVIALADRRSHLERRLLAMKPITTQFARTRVGLSLAAGMLALMAACETRLPTTAEISAMDVAGAERSVARTPFTSGADMANAAFYINGVKATAEEAHRIAPNRIASIAVEKASAGSAAVVRVSTTGVRDVAESDDGRTVKDGALPAHSASQSFNGIIFIDGLRVDGAAFAKLQPGDIASVEVVKGPAALALVNEPAAANGIIKVTMKGP